MNRVPTLGLEGAGIGDATGDCGSGRHERTGQNGARTGTLTPLEVAVGGRHGEFSGGNLVLVHGQTGRASGLTQLETGLGENLVETFLAYLTVHTP